MLYLRLVLFILLVAMFNSCKEFEDKIVYKSDNLKIIQISPKSFIHISYLQAKSFGKVACNGLIFIDNKEAFILDTPTNIEASEELIQFITSTNKATIIGVLANHYHVDCLGGLAAFHDKNIDSYARFQTISLVDTNEFERPKIGFRDSLLIQVGNETIQNQYLGEAHTIDNIVSYIASEKLLFGGCMIKCIGAGKGNLADANVDQWPITVEKVKMKFQNAQKIIPGHGPHGDRTLLDYTIEKFAKH